MHSNNPDKCWFLQSDVTEEVNLPPFTHIYNFDIGWKVKEYRKVAKEIIPEIEEIQARMEEIGVGSLTESEWNGTASYCPVCENGTHEPNEVGRFANLVDACCSKCTEYYCHLCRPVFILNSEDCICYYCIVDDQEGEFEINPADIPRIHWVASQL